MAGLGMHEGAFLGQVMKARMGTGNKMKLLNRNEANPAQGTSACI